MRVFWLIGALCAVASFISILIRHSMAPIFGIPLWVYLVIDTLGLIINGSACLADY